jgi:hypothetical protein
MLCPVCGRNDGLCDCLLRSAPREANDGSGHAAVQGISASTDGADGADRVTEEPLGLDGRTGAQAVETGSREDWADGLLQFVREFADASPNASIAATAARSGRDGSDECGPEGTSPGQGGEQTAIGDSTADDASPDPAAPGGSEQASVQTSPSSKSVMPAPQSPAGAPLRIAPFVASGTGGAKADMSARPAPARSKSGSTNSAWSGRELE